MAPKPIKTESASSKATSIFNSHKPTPIRNKIHPVIDNLRCMESLLSAQTYKNCNMNETFSNE